MDLVTPPTGTIADLYKRFRTEGYRANHAFSNAKRCIEFSLMGDNVRVRKEIDDTPETVFDFECDCAVRQCKCKDEVSELVNTYGVVGIIGEYRADKEWIHADSVWGFIDNEDTFSGSLFDVMDEACAQYRANMGGLDVLSEKLTDTKNSIQDFLEYHDKNEDVNGDILKMLTEISDAVLLVTAELNKD